MRNLASTAILIILLCYNTTYSESRDTDPKMNLALGKPVQYAPMPNYELTAKNSTDSTDLTDGVLSDQPRGHLWFNHKCVGWSYANRCNLALDLGEVYPIDEVAIRIQGGSPQAGICTPVWMELLVSDDGNIYRLADEYSTFHEADESRFGVPKYEGKAWVHRFRFRNLRTRARFVGLRMYMTGLTVADEIYIFRGDHDPQTCNLNSLPATDFSVKSPQMYFHKPYLCFTTNVNTPNPIGLVMPPEALDQTVTVTMDLPRGTWLIGGGLGNAQVSDRNGDQVNGKGILQPVALYHNDRWVIEGINACNSKSTVVNLGWSNLCIVRRMCGWNAADGNTNIFAAHYGEHNLFEDCAGWGVARKTFSCSQGGNYTMFRRCFGSWEGCHSTGLKMAFTIFYNSHHVTAENCIAT